ncbi:VTT domain-containing protein [Paraburkholderia rhizosphaerae]|uniref:Phosphatidylserine/phosphatidylglycerophosphate/ cardiolipin synthase-like enzyme n=1 Tax=Paraburkholderia rhizosphaerae TaxID=480658 RepID=A0A4R8L8G6_9BURK|nr:VTT domain-containing protein [Paraburkholderia rhizosphaerae]TDY39062.1 phosphatidylserine/phosphatidylglycerophosphate/cardiolipin synthase-like enzyme [Paraburkholderia rhizosphaerae]
MMMREAGQILDDPSADPGRPPSSTPPDAWLEPGRTCEWLRCANRLRVLIDAADYFDAVRAAMARARNTIFIVGWDIDSRLQLTPEGARDGLPAGLADFLCALVEKQRHLRIYVLAWDFAMLYAFEREWLPVYKLGWRTHRRVRFQLDGRHPLGGSHHQKIVVVDDRVAFAGGIDLTRSRWDTPEHEPHAPLRRNANAAPYQPMHDVHAMFDGPAAAALGELARERWRRASARRIELPPVCGTAAGAADTACSDPWPEHVRADIENVELGIALTEPAYANRAGVQQIERMYLDAIARARDSIYIENQYFTASRVGAALAASLAQPNGPDIAVVGPERQTGWLQHTTMGVMRARLHRLIKQSDQHGHYAMLAPTIGGTAHDEFINVHSKLMTVDDELLLIGSANLNNRSMVLDTECNIALDARGDPRVRAMIASVRDRLLAEHLDTTPAAVASALATQRLNTAIASLRHGERTLAALDPVVPDESGELATRMSVFDPEAPLAPQELVRQFLPEAESRPLRGKLLALGSFALFVAVLAVLWRFTPLRDMLSFAALVHAAHELHGSRFGPLAIVAVYVLAASVSVPVTLLIAVSGFVFGALAGSAYAFSGTLISAALTYYAGAALGHDAVRDLAGSRINRISEKLGKKGFVAIVIARIVPVAPFTLINLVAGASHIGLRDYLAGTALGMAPGIVLATTFAQQLVAAVHHPSLTGILLVAAIGAVLVGLSVALHRFFARRS